MKTESAERSTSINYYKFIKILAIVATWKGIIVLALSQIEGLSPFVQEAIDTFALTLFSGLNIYFLIILPENRKKQKEYSILYEQKINAINSVAIITTADVSGKIIFANDNFCKISGYSHEEIIMQDHRIVNSGYHSKEFFEQMWSTIKSGKTWRGQIRNKNKNGEIFWVETHIVPIFDTQVKPFKYISFRFDITSEKLAEAELEIEKIKSIHMGRLSAIGEMAGGIAHEINNPLTVVKGILQIIERKLQADNSIEELPKILVGIAKIQNQVIRITKIIKGLRDFSRKEGEEVLEKVSILNIFSTVEDLCCEKIKNNNVQFEIHSDEIEIEIQCNLIQIEQVLVNLISNSIDAISNHDIRWIRLEAIRFGEFVEISVTDSGAGISEDLSQKIMQPFFTTKETGKGTGLGLSISHGIIEKHGGTINLDPCSRNTRFVIQIPLNDSSFLELINFDEAIFVHLKRRQKILSFFLDLNTKIDLETVHFGKENLLENWMIRIEPRFKTNLHFIELKIALKNFNNCASEIVRNSHEGDFESIKSSLGQGSDYDLLCSRVVTLLETLKLNMTSAKNEFDKCG
ncbi:MAG: PAS domain S-box protein [Bacteriovorax sp.]|nr:PAS domain S-box protein [Bacteriovorax sp.]